MQKILAEVLVLEDIQRHVSVQFTQWCVRRERFFPKQGRARPSHDGTVYITTFLTASGHLFIGLEIWFFPPQKYEKFYENVLDTLCL